MKVNGEWARVAARVIGNVVWSPGISAPFKYILDDAVVLLDKTGVFAELQWEHA